MSGFKIFRFQRATVMLWGPQCHWDLNVVAPSAPEQPANVLCFKCAKVFSGDLNTELVGYSNFQKRLDAK